MPPLRRAVIDVGTNSVKLLIADIVDSTAPVIEPVLEESKQTRLGLGFYESRRLQPEPVAKTARAVARFTAQARELGASSVRVIATSAARDAINASDLIQAIQVSARVDVEVISGDQEADWAFQGVTSDPALATGPLLIFDVGGGSTEFIFGEGQQKHFRQSFPIGTVRLLEKLPPGDPPAPSDLSASRDWIHTFLAREVAPRLGPVLETRMRNGASKPGFTLVGTGGSTSILSRMELQMADYDRARIEGTPLSLARVQWHRDRLWTMPLSERRALVGLPPKRADVILFGVLVCEAVMQQFGCTELRVSTRGLRFAALLDG